MKLVDAISQRLKNLLAERNISQYYLYKNGGIARTTINDIVNKRNLRVSTEVIYQICSTLNITLSEFFNDPLFENLDD